MMAEALITQGVALAKLGRYPEAVTEMESRAAGIADQRATELVWLLGQGVSLGLSGLFGALSGLTRTATTA